MIVSDHFSHNVIWSPCIYQTTFKVNVFFYALQEQENWNPVIDTVTPINKATTWGSESEV